MICQVPYTVDNKNLPRRTGKTAIPNSTTKSYFPQPHSSSAQPQPPEQSQHTLQLPSQHKFSSFNSTPHFLQSI